MTASGLHRRSNVLEHLLVTVLNAGDANAPHHLAFETAGVTSVDDVLELNKDGLKYLSWLGTLISKLHAHETSDFLYQISFNFLLPQERGDV